MQILSTFNKSEFWKIEVDLICRTVAHMEGFPRPTAQNCVHIMYVHLQNIVPSWIQKSIFQSFDLVDTDDLQILLHYQAQIRQQGNFESLHRDMIVGFGKWDFTPLDIKNPFPNNEGAVHLWHGDQDWIVPVGPMRYIAQKLPWIRYHEVPGAGHMFLLADGFSDAIVKALLLGDQQGS